jgi:hypothetical protein
VNVVDDLDGEVVVDLDVDGQRGGVACRTALLTASRTTASA